MSKHAMKAVPRPPSSLDFSITTTTIVVLSIPGTSRMRLMARRQYAS